MTKPSNIYYKALDLTRHHHATQEKTFSGQFTWKMKHRIKEVIDRFDVKSILDYGCGKCKQYRNIDPDTGQSLEEFWGITTTKYDPGVKGYDKEPTGKYDLVICVQVLGSIPKVDLPWVVDNLYGFANKTIFVTERITIPRKQIYASIEEEMPRGMSAADWLQILCRPIETPKMIVALKEDKWSVKELSL